jgi:hypothetical protein
VNWRGTDYAMAEWERTNIDLYNTTQKTKDRATRTSVKPIFRKVKQFLLHMWHPSCYSFFKPEDKSHTRKRPGYDYDKRHVSIVIWHRYSVTVNQVLVTTVKLSSDEFNLTNKNHWLDNFLVPILLTHTSSSRLH